MRRATVMVVIALVCIFSLVAGAGGPATGRAHAAEDTGTYRILSYIVTIHPQPDGSWIAGYSQDWEVTGGHIPWVTVGLPDSNYTILSYEGAATQVSRADYGSWSGVRVDLDRDYTAGETFSFSFRVRQEGMGHRKDDAVEFAFVPGWYDRAETERLEVRLRNPGDPEDLLYASPEPAERTEDQVVWTARLGPGERFKVAFAFPPHLFPDLKARAGSLPGATDDWLAGDAPSTGASMFPVFPLVFMAFIIIFFLIVILASASRGGYTGRRGIYYGTYFPIPPVGGSSWGPGPFRSPESSGSSGGSRRSGGGGGFGGRSIGCACVSCACACVACACACACAGGGGAGCARKFDGARPARVATRAASTASEVGMASTAGTRGGDRDENGHAPPDPGAAGLGRTYTMEQMQVCRSSRALRALVVAAICVSVLSLAAACRPGARNSAGLEPGDGHALAPPAGAASDGLRGSRPYDENVEVPSGDPAFPALGRYWVVDPDGLVGLRAVEAADQTLEALRADGFAETVIVVQRGVKHPAEWSTHYGRWLMLGEREGPRRNNGLVFLIIPDARPEAGRVWYSVGRGLPHLTSSDLGPLIEEAASYANAGDLDGAVVSIARNIDDILRKIYGEGEH